ncbi:hypothetical protein PGB34_04960 [Xenophilus arseniciresistens]|uniref:Uncharacterized protein n=1 Tax=Xenophilus arseniciresistens TaxID=1283306 RepID=A0AAE3N7C4_9BURK|nr:hypothetical protein [Xenophilus arseniciresistens]MDA7415706.1 hypothetical protein [Xenophilus arseniciresistens]
MSAPAASPTASPSTWKTAALRLAGWATAAAVLLGVLALYLRPGFLVMLSDMIWACFGG